MGETAILVGETAILSTSLLRTPVVLTGCSHVLLLSVARSPNQAKITNAHGTIWEGVDESDVVIDTGGFEALFATKASNGYA